MCELCEDAFDSSECSHLQLTNVREYERSRMQYNNYIVYANTKSEQSTLS